MLAATGNNNGKKVPWRSVNTQIPPLTQAFWQSQVVVKYLWDASLHAFPFLTFCPKHLLLGTVRDSIQSLSDLYSRSPYTLSTSTARNVEEHSIARVSFGRCRLKPLQEEMRSESCHNPSC